MNYIHSIELTPYYTRYYAVVMPSSVEGTEKSLILFTHKLFNVTSSDYAFYAENSKSRMKIVDIIKETKFFIPAIV